MPSQQEINGFLDSTCVASSMTFLVRKPVEAMKYKDILLFARQASAKLSQCDADGYFLVRGATVPHRHGQRQGRGPIAR